MYYFFNGLVNIKNLDLNKIKVEEKLCKNIIYQVGCVAPNCVKPLYLITNKTNRYIENNEKKHLTLVPADVNKETLIKMKNYGIKSKILLDQQTIPQMIIGRNI